MVAGDVDVEFPAPLTAVFVVEIGAVFAPLAVVVGLLPVALCTGALLPLAAVPEPLTVEAFTVVAPDVLTSPEPLFVALTAVDPEASVTALVGLIVVGALVVLVLPAWTGAAVPLAAVPEPLTVAAFTVVEPDALTAPDPVFVALTVVEPDALVIAVCANADAPRPSSAALTAVAIKFLGYCSLVIVISLLSVA